VGGALAAALEARALGKMHRSEDACKAIGAAEVILSQLDAESVIASAFGYNEAQLRFHEGNALTHLHDMEPAWRAQQRALDLYPESDYLDRTLVRLDRAACLAQDGDLSGAMGYATEAFVELSEEERQGLLTTRGREILRGLPSSARGARGSGIPRPADDDRRVGRGRVVLTIEHATAADIARLAELMEEMDRFYGAAEVEPQARREKEIGEALFGTRPVAYALLAKDRRDVVGLASYSLLWPAAGLTSSLFLKELYVRQDKRRRGVGRRLMRELCAIAVAAGCSRVEWQTEDANERARRFYEALGAPVFAGKVFYRLECDGLRRLTES